jgi:uncharacterized protein (DUF2236 family)
MGSPVSMASLQIDPLPPGGRPEPGIFSPQDVWWEVMRERVTLVGGLCALLLQVANPRVAAGVLDHSSFDVTPVTRLNATMRAVLHVTFGDKDQAEAAARRVSRRHAPVVGRVGSMVATRGENAAYSAADPVLSRWVLIGLVWTAHSVMNKFVRTLDTDESDRFVEEAGRFGALFGVQQPEWPRTWNDLERQFTTSIATQVEVGPGAARIATSLLSARYTGILRVSPLILESVTSALLPPALRHPYRLDLTARRRMVDRAATSAIRGSLPALPRSVRFWPHEDAALRRIFGSKA